MVTSIKIPMEELENRLTHLRIVLENIWADVHSLQTIDGTIREMENDGKEWDPHYIRMLNHYRKLMQFHLCLSLCKLCDDRGENTLKNIGGHVRMYAVCDLPRAPKCHGYVWQKMRDYRNKYIAHLDYVLPEEPLINEEMISCVQPLTDYYNAVCKSVPDCEKLVITSSDIGMEHMIRFMDLWTISQKFRKEIPRVI